MGRFLIGFAIGLAIGVAAALLATPRAGGPARKLSDMIRGALEAARAASATREEELWAEFHGRIERDKLAKAKPAPANPWETHER